VNSPLHAEESTVNITENSSGDPKLVDIYFTHAYGHADAVRASAKWILIHDAAYTWQMPLLVNENEAGHLDAASPYGYSGVYAHPHLSPTDLQNRWRNSRQTLHEMGVVTLLLRHSPLAPQAPDQPDARIVVSDHPTQAVDTTDLSDAWCAMEGRSRTAVRKALRSGLTADLREATIDDLAPGAPFRRLYSETMARLGAADNYQFSDLYFEELMGGMSERLLLATVTDALGTVGAAALFMRHAARLHYHLSGSTPDAARLGANNLMLWHAIESAGAEIVHLGGGVSPRDHLYRFKRSFGGAELNYRVTGYVLDHGTYTDLLERRANELSIPTHILLQTRHFPPYRAPSPSAVRKAADDA